MRLREREFMKLLTEITIILSLCLPLKCWADSGDRAKQNLFGLTPLYTLNARNVQNPVINFSHEDFNNVRIDEAKDFNGYTQAIEVLVPFGEQNRWEVRLEVPFNTRGHAKTIANDESIYIRGNGGVFDFTTLTLQRELDFINVNSINSSIFFGYGHRTKELDTTIKDKYNHRGQLVHLGYNIDNAKPDNDLRIQATADFRYYFDTDDLNPSNGEDSFQMLNISSAAVYNYENMIKPVFEVLYSTDFEDRQIIQAVPELIVPVTDWLEIKGGYALGYSSGEGSVQTATLRTTFNF